MKQQIVHLLKLPAELGGFEVLQNSIGLLVQLRDVLPETIHGLLPGHCGGLNLAHWDGLSLAHCTGIAACQA